MSEARVDRRKSKEVRVLEMHDQGMYFRKIASTVHLSLRDVTKYIRRISNKTKSTSTTSIMDEVVLEYRVSGLRREINDLQTERHNLRNEVINLRAQKHDLQNQLRVRQIELDVVKMDLENERFSNDILKVIFDQDDIPI